MLFCPCCQFCFSVALQNSGRGETNDSRWIGAYLKALFSPMWIQSVDITFWFFIWHVVLDNLRLRFQCLEIMWPLYHRTTVPFPAKRRYVTEKRTCLDSLDSPQGTLSNKVAHIYNNTNFVSVSWIMWPFSIFTLCFCRLFHSFIRNVEGCQ